MQNLKSGLILVDKPAGVSSAAVVSRIKKIYRVKKAGHTGTLDPFATGLLICSLNKATRLSRFFLHSDKAYEGILHLGTQTDTQDSTGCITAKSDMDIKNKKHFSRARIQSIFDQFQGTIHQAPPVFSALKHNGIPLYKLARAGKPFQKPPRPTTIYAFNAESIDLPFVYFKVKCSAGTYIRTLCADVGNALGCGGHLKELRRTESCGLSIEQATPLDDFEILDNNLLHTKILSMSNALDFMPSFTASQHVAQKIKNGIKLSLNDELQAPSGSKHHTQATYLKVVDTNDTLIAVLEYHKNSHRFSYCCVFNN